MQFDLDEEDGFILFGFGVRSKNTNVNANKINFLVFCDRRDG